MPQQGSARPLSQQQADYPRFPQQNRQYGAAQQGASQRFASTGPLRDNVEAELFSGPYAHTVADEQRLAGEAKPWQQQGNTWRPGEYAHFADEAASKG